MSTVCLHLFPKACVDVFVTVIEDDGSVLAASLTAAGVALADAGIEMFDTVIGSAVVLEGELPHQHVDVHDDDDAGIEMFDTVIGSAVVLEGELPHCTAGKSSYLVPNTFWSVNCLCRL